MRIGINISDNLRERIRPLMSVTNISQICRDAIKSYVESYERAKTRTSEDHMEKVVERLSKELTPEIIDWGALGLEDAKLWVQLAKLEDFEYLLHRLDVLKRQGRSPYDVPVPHLQGAKSFGDRHWEHKEWFIRQFEKDDGIDHDQLAKSEYEQAYLNYILAVWHMVQERVAANTEAIVKSLKEKREKSLKEGLENGRAKAELLAEQ